MRAHSYLSLHLDLWNFALFMAALTFPLLPSLDLFGWADVHNYTYMYVHLLWIHTDVRRVRNKFVHARIMAGGRMERVKEVKVEATHIRTFSPAATGVLHDPS